MPFQYFPSNNFFSRVCSNLIKKNIVTVEQKKIFPLNQYVLHKAARTNKNRKLDFCSEQFFWDEYMAFLKFTEICGFHSSALMVKTGTISGPSQ